MPVRNEIKRMNVDVRCATDPELQCPGALCAGGPPVRRHRVPGDCVQQHAAQMHAPHWARQCARAGRLRARRSQAAPSGRTSALVTGNAEGRERRNGRLANGLSFFGGVFFCFNNSFAQIETLHLPDTFPLQVATGVDNNCTLGVRFAGRCHFVADDVADDGSTALAAVDSAFERLHLARALQVRHSEGGCADVKRGGAD